MNSNRLAGHELIREGASYGKDGCCRVYGLLHTREGHGLCRCGAKSDHLDSHAARKRWHREHKDEIRAGGQS